MANRLNPFQALWVEGSIATFNASSLFAGGQLGMFVQQSGNVYQLVKVASGADTPAAGNVVWWTGDLNAFTVSQDISDDATGVYRPAGVLVFAVTAGNYGFIQVRGEYGTIKTDGGDDIASGDWLIVDPSVDGAVDSVAGGNACTHPPVGVATAADVDGDNTVKGMIIVTFNGA